MVFSLVSCCSGFMRVFMTILDEGCLCCPFFLSSALVTQSSYSSGLILRFVWNVGFNLLSEN